MHTLHLKIDAFKTSFRDGLLAGAMLVFWGNTSQVNFEWSSGQVSGPRKYHDPKDPVAGWQRNF